MDFLTVPTATFRVLFVLVMLWRGVRAARRGDIDTHMKTMRGTYFFGLIITGLLTLIPGRTMYAVAFGPEGATPMKLAIFALMLVALSARAAPLGMTLSAYPMPTSSTAVSTSSTSIRVCGLVPLSCSILRRTIRVESSSRQVVSGITNWA